MPDPLVESWRRNGDAVLALFDWLPEEALAARYSARTRTVAAQFAHLHSVRVYHLQGRGRRFVGDLQSFPRGAEPTRREIRAALVASAEAIERILEDCAAAGSVPSWKGPPATFLAYLVAHEAHHRGLAMVALRASGVRVPKEIVYGLWELWSKERGTAAGPAAPGKPRLRPTTGARAARKGKR